MRVVTFAAACFTYSSLISKERDVSCLQTVHILYARSNDTEMLNSRFENGCCGPFEIGAGTQVKIMLGDTLSIGVFCNVPNGNGTAGGLPYCSPAFETLDRVEKAFGHCT